LTPHKYQIKRYNTPMLVALTGFICTGANRYFRYSARTASWTKSTVMATFT